MESGSKKWRCWKNDLPDTIQITIGMKVMVTKNIETDLDITNGARGEIVDIILDPDEPPIGNDPIVTLKHLPAHILVKMARTRATQLEGLLRFLPMPTIFGQSPLFLYEPSMSY